MRASSHAVAEHHVLLGQFQQHRVVEELVDADVFTETLCQPASELLSTHAHVNAHHYKVSP